MNVLAFDTTLNSCSAAAALSGVVAAARGEARVRGHAERIVPMIREVMREADIVAADLDLIAVTIGPGTFTGVRIGLAAARAFALPQQTPVLGIGTLEAIASDVDANGPVLVAVDARRGQIYCQLFAAGARPVNDAQALTPERAALLGREVFPQGGHIAGSGVDLLRPLLADWLAIEMSDDESLAVTMTRMAAERSDLASAGKPPSPLYLRAPDARLPAHR
jgi:tRNA threonylcarbamoyladenosine biosynthesis protein TsaB